MLDLENGEGQTEDENSVIDGEVADITPKTDTNHPPEDAPVEEVAITFGDPPPEPTEEEQEHQREQARPWVRELRKANKEKDRVIRELQAQVNAGKQQMQAPELVLGKEPTLADHDYDEAAYSAALKQHAAKELEIAQAKRQKDEAANAEKTAWDNKYKAYQQSAAKLGVEDFEDAEANVAKSFSQTQQGIMIKALANPAAMVAAIGNNAIELAAAAVIKDPIEFTAYIAKLETKMTITPKKSTAPPPERAIRGGASVTSTTDSKMDALIAEAQRTGDGTKLRAYKNALRQKQ
jgi:hypothetical protein